MARPVPGSYSLARDVVNPLPRPRMKSDWTRAAVWKAGTMFVITPRSTDKPRGPIVIHDVKNANTWLDETEHAAQVKALVKALVPVGENLETVFARLGVAAYDLEEFLRYLVETEVLSLEAFEQQFTAWSRG